MRRLFIASTLFILGCQPNYPASHPGPDAWRTADKAVAPKADVLIAIDQARDVVAENIRNADTAGYKARRIEVNAGKPVIALDLYQGKCNNTGRPFDVAISGEGFFAVKTPEGVAYTRNGHLFVNNTNDLLIGDDHYDKSCKLLPQISIPSDATEVNISQSGSVTVLRAGQIMKTQVGQIKLHQFRDAAKLKLIPENLYQQTEASGEAIESEPQENGAGQLLQSFIESSNVEIQREKMRDEYLRNWRDDVMKSK